MYPYVQGGYEARKKTNQNDIQQSKSESKIRENQPREANESSPCPSRGVRDGTTFSDSERLRTFFFSSQQFPSHLEHQTHPSFHPWLRPWMEISCQG